MKKIKFLSVFAVIAGLLLMNSCSEEFLEITPNGSLDQTVLATYNGVDALLIGAYSMIDGVANGYGWEAASSGWVFGSIRGLEANKGTDSGDQPAINPLQTYSETATNGYLNAKWRSCYEGVSRANTTISVAAKALEAGGITQEEYDSFVMQARALRGVYHFWAYKLWADMATGTFVPYVDETTDSKTVTNDVDIRPMIIADLEAGTNLPLNMGQIGRFNKTVCQVFLAKAQMQMYGDYAAALSELNEVVTSGTQPAGGEIGLLATYGDIFDTEFRNDKEAVYTVQYSVNDNSGAWNAGRGEVLNFPYKSGASPGGCCGFFNPTQEFVNSFRVDPATGLPLLDGSYNNSGEELLRDMGIAAGGIWVADDGDPETTVGQYLINDVVTAYDPANPYIDLAYRSLTGTESSPNVNNDPLTSPSDWELIWTEDNSLPLDPRLDWSAGRRGIPYWDWGIHTGSDWIRDQSYSGPYSPKKQVYKKSQEGTYTEVGNWTSGYTANGYRMIRYADVLLLKAECEAQTNADDLGFGEVNLIRERAGNTAGWVYEEDGTTPAANYMVNEYTSPFANTADAMEKIMMERKLELGQEGHRYYDLQRWGIMVTEGNRILDYEKTMPWGNALYGNATVGAEDVNFPIPQRQIDVSNGILQQNR